MKVFAILFALAVLMLSTQTCCLGHEVDCDATQQAEQNCSSEKEMPCIPFFSCGTCLGFAPDNFQDQLEFFTEHETKIQTPHFQASIPDRPPMRIRKPPREFSMS